MSRRVILDTEEFSNAYEMVHAIANLLSTADHYGTDAHCVYVESSVNGFYVHGKARLVRDTLTDGSFVFNIEFGGPS